MKLWEKLDNHAKETDKLREILNTKVDIGEDRGYEIRIYNDLKIFISEYPYGCGVVSIDVKNWGRVKEAIDRLLNMEEPK